MAYYTPTQLTTVFRQTLEPAFAGHKVKILVVPFKGNDLGLLLIVENPPIPQYLNEKVMFGKSLRTVVYLEEKCYLLSLLKTYNLSGVIVTEADDPSRMVKTNTTNFDNRNLEIFFNDFAELRAFNESYLEAGIVAAIAANAKY